MANGPIHPTSELEITTAFDASLTEIVWDSPDQINVVHINTAGLQAAAGFATSETRVNYLTLMLTSTEVVDTYLKADILAEPTGKLIAAYLAPVRTILLGVASRQDLLDSEIPTHPDHPAFVDPAFLQGVILHHLSLALREETDFSARDDGTDVELESTDSAAATVLSPEEYAVAAEKWASYIPQIISVE